MSFLLDPAPRAAPSRAATGCGPVLPLGLPRHLPQRRRQITEQVLVAPLAGAGAGDQDVIGPLLPVARQHFGRRRAQTPLRAVADHRIADLATCREPDPHGRVADPGWSRRRL